jgi:hypothetical protein
MLEQVEKGQNNLLRLVRWYYLLLLAIYFSAYFVFVIYLLGYLFICLGFESLARISIFRYSSQCK